MLVIFELDADKDVVNAESQLNETVTYFRGMTPVTDTLTTPQNVVDLGATARLISGTCQ
jgi:hypothetical protein